jgi:hypothetical protein
MPFLGLITALAFQQQPAPAPVRDLDVADWVSPVQSQSPSGVKPAKSRTVAMFYFLANHVPGAPIFDITKLLALNPDTPAYGPFGSAHWWGEPWFGYYQSDDPWVIRKHMQMLANAGVDVLVFDNTNGPTYPDVYIPLCQVLEQMKAQGLKAPQIAFFTGHGAWNTIQNDLYSKGLYSDLWFQWKGKPLMLAHLEKGDQLPPSVLANFSVRESWAWTTGDWFGDGHDKWSWLDNYPQNFGWHESAQVPEEVSVSVAQHATTSIGRSSNAQKEPTVDAQRLTAFTTQGICFSQQFEKALSVDPECLFITGWNEWTATRFKADTAAVLAGKPEPSGGSVFVDEYNAEFSRDIEPAKGLLQDSYYYMLVDFIRRYKGTASTPVANSMSRIKLSGPFSQWDAVTPEYRDAVGDVTHRNHAGWGSQQYMNNTGRNDIVAAKVAYDNRNVYFMVQAQDVLTPWTDPNWMMLYVNVPGQVGDRWLGYNFAINRSRNRNQVMVEANVGGTYSWDPIGQCDYRVEGKNLMISVPRRMLGVTSASATLLFKWADNIAQTGEPSDFTENGDVAPDDRFNYRAILQ